MTALWTSQDAEKATGGKAHGQWQASGVSIDTRSLLAGDFFVALSDVRDGHEFVAEALQKGAAAALVSRIPDGLPKTAPLLVVPDVQQALEKLGRAARARSQAQVIAITGSVGKTSTKDMLCAVLSRQGRTHGAVESYNNHWGVPLTLARMPVDCDYAVIEIGMNHPGEIAPLAQIAAPHVALITTVAAVHLAAFVDVADIAREKAAIFSGVVPGGTAIYDIGLPVTSILADAASKAGLRQLVFGENDGADARLIDVQLTSEQTVIKATLADQELLFKLAVPGRHFALNALAALVGVQALGADVTIAALDLADWRPTAGRGIRETIVLDVVDDHLSLQVFDDAFNASPVSMAAGLEVLVATKPVAPGRRMAILGDMLELGDDEIQHHRDLANLNSIEHIDVIHCVGPRMRALYDALAPHQRGQWVETAPEMAAAAHGLLKTGDVILVKGSKGSKVSLVVDAIRKLGHPQAPALQGTT